MSIIEQIAELQRINERIEKIKTDDNYIREKANEIFGNKKYIKTTKADIEAILKECF